MEFIVSILKFGICSAIRDTKQRIPDVILYCCTLILPVWLVDRNYSVVWFIHSHMDINFALGVVGGEMSSVVPRYMVDN